MQARLLHRILHPGELQCIGTESTFKKYLTKIEFYYVIGCVIRQSNTVRYTMAFFWPKGMRHHHLYLILTSLIIAVLYSDTIGERSFPS